MGASQSANGGGGGNGGAASAPAAKTSYYELLAVARDATEDEIKKAYRRKALELHPDRNYGNEEAATKTFAEIQAAYEVLSDPQERAWYDSHESAILRGDDEYGDRDGAAPTYANIKITTADDLARLVRKFNSNVEFNDAPSGFFGFVRETFEHLAQEEEAAARLEGTVANEYPTFGHRDDAYDDVVRHFYAAWSGFASVKSFAWQDKYRLSEAPDRWYRRRMEQENQRIRLEARREFNDAVRSLVAFIRKRDPRYVPNVQSEQERQETLRNAAAAQAARARAANAAKMSDQVPEWTLAREPDELEDDTDEEDEVEEVFECVACEKIFKSERQWQAHEKSKKHQKTVKALQYRMRKQNASLGLTEDGLDPDSDFIEVDGDPEDMETGHVHGNDARRDEEHPEESGALTEEHDDKTPENVRTKPDAAKSGSEQEGSQSDSPAGTNNEQEDSDHSASENEDYASIEAIQARMQSSTLQSHTDENGSEDESSSAVMPKMGKAAQKRAKKAAAAANTAAVADANGQQCEVCNATFPSRTALFKHIKDEGHAALKTVNGAGGKGKKGKAKSKR